MSTVEIIALVVMFAGIFVGMAAAAVLVGRRPAFWGGLVLFLMQRAWPYIKSYVTGRDPPEIEAKKVECARRGGEWDNFRKVCRDK